MSTEDKVSECPTTAPEVLRTVISWNQRVFIALSVRQITYIKMSRIRMIGLRRITKGHTKSTSYVPCCMVKLSIKSPGDMTLKNKL